MKVTVHYSAHLRQATGVATESIELEPLCSLPELVSRLVSDRGTALRHLLLEPQGELRNSVLTIVNDEQVHWQTPTQLQEGDDITFLSALAGG
jgi:molybdopterin converting factor small subunit